MMEVKLCRNEVELQKTISALLTLGIQSFNVTHVKVDSGTAQAMVDEAFKVSRDHYRIEFEVKK